MSTALPDFRLPKPPPRDLTEQSACGNYDADDAEWVIDDAQNAAQLERAKEVCATCPVLAGCLRYALEEKVDFDIWGGMLPGERIQHGYRIGLRRTRPMRHGTTSGYETHRRRGEAPCLACQTAMNAYQKSRRDTAKVANPIQHGTVKGYRQHGRRNVPPCEPCREAWLAARST